MVRIVISGFVFLVGVFLSLISIFAAAALLLGFVLFISYKRLKQSSPAKAAKSVEPQQQESTVERPIRRANSQKTSIILVALIALIATFFATFLILPSPWSNMRRTLQAYTKIEKYRATIVPRDSNLQEFTLIEEVELSGPIRTELKPYRDKDVDPFSRKRKDEDVESSLPQSEDTKKSSFRLQERTISSTSAGFLTKKIFYIPLDARRAFGWNQLVLNNGKPLYLMLNDFDCENVSIELRNIPKGSFQSARDSQKEVKQPFAETETVSWSVRNLEHSVGISFVKPGFEMYRPILSPFLGLSSMNGWVAALVVLCSAVLIAGVVDFAKDKIKARLGKGKQEEPKKKPAFEDDESGKDSPGNNDINSAFE